jgi:pilus assembly protein CpaC
VVALAVLSAGTPSRGLAQSAPTEALQLQVGEQRTLTVPGFTNFSEGVPGVVRVKPIPGGVVVIGRRPGTTTLLALNSDGRPLVEYQITVIGEEAPDEVQKEDNIRLDFYFVQVSESYAHQIGIGFPSVLGGNGVVEASVDLLAPAVLGATAAISEQPLPRVDLLQTSGWARVMRQMALITVNGNEAVFESGGEVNVPVAAGLTSQLQQVTFGSTVRIRPRFDRDSGRIEVRVNADVSELADDRGTGVPGRDTSHLETRVNLEMGQSLVLAGLIAERRRQSRSGFPGLSQIPIIGPLFSTNSRQDEAVQNLLFVVPTVVDVVSQRARDQIERAFEVYWDYSGDLDDVRMLQTPQGVPSGANPDAKSMMDEDGDDD